MTVPVGSVCTGYGGLDLAIGAVLPDAELRWCADYEPPTAKIPRPVQGPARVIARRFPGVPNLGDITAVRWPETEHVEVVAGGTPCQDVSVSGAGAGMRAGTRSGIWSSMVDAIRHHRPALVVWENVGGALSAGADSNLEPCPVCVGDDGNAHLRALGRVVGDLAEIGYDARWTVVSAADVGACHRRERVWVFAWPAADPRNGRCETRSEPGQPGPAGIQRRDVAGRIGSAAAEPESTRPQGHIARNAEPEVTRPRRDSGPTAADAQGDRWGERWPESEGQLGRPHAAERGAGPAADAGREPVREQPESVAGGSSPAVPGLDRAAAADAERDRLPGRAEETPEPPHQQREGSRATTPGHRADPVNWGDFGSAIRRWESVLGRPAPAPTAPNSRGGQALSPAFVEWMMGLPAGWVTDPDLWHRLTPAAARNAQLKLLGNGVVPQQAEAALRWGLALAPDWVRARLGYTLAS